MRLSAPLVASTCLAGCAVVAELPSVEAWEASFVPVRQISVTLVIAAAIIGILGVSQLRSSSSRLGVAVATLGFAMLICAAVATHYYRMELRSMLMEEMASRQQLDADAMQSVFASLGAQIMRWTMIGAAAGVAAVVGIGLVSRRLVVAGVAALASVFGLVVAVAYATTSPSDLTMGHLLIQPWIVDASWLAGLAIVVVVAGAPSPMLSSDGFRRAARAGWMRAIVLAISFGVSLGGTPLDHDALEIVRGIQLVAVIATIVAFVMFAWGAVDAARLDEPPIARYVLVAAASLVVIAASALISLAPALYLGRDIAIDHFDAAQEVVPGLGFVAAMIGCALIIRRHGLHDIRGGALVRIGFVIVLIALTFAVVTASDDTLHASPRAVLRTILLVAASVMVAREWTNVAHRLTRVPEMPTATLL